MRRILKMVLGLALCTTAFLYDNEPSASLPTEVEAVSHQGIGAQIRARLDRIRLYVENGESGEAVVASDRLLADLQTHLIGSSWGSDDEVIGGAAAEGLARALIPVRNAALQSVRPFSEGSKGDFLRALVDGAVYADWRHGVPASVTLAQAVLESNWGRSAPGFNLFGMKGVGPAGSTKRKGMEYRGKRRRAQWSSFRAYHSVEGSLEDHARLLSTSRVYARARAVQEDPDAYVRALQGTYASDPAYARKLSKMMTGMGLRAYNWVDTSPLAVPPASPKIPEAPSVPDGVLSRLEIALSTAPAPL